MRIALETPPELTTRHLSAIGRELDYTLVAVAVAASISSARAYLRPVVAGLEIAHYLPGEPRLASAASVSICNPGLTPTTLRQLADFNALVEAARSMMMAVAEREGCTLENMASVPKTRVRDGDWINVSGLWRRSAAVGDTVSNAVHDLCANGDVQHADRPSSLSRLIQSICAGESPCVDRIGRIVYPQWAERRQSERRQLNTPAELSIVSGSDVLARIDVTIRDASEGGLGLRAIDIDRHHCVRQGARAIVTLKSARRFDGFLVWVDADRVGLRLTEPLFPSDPLLAPTA